MTTEEIVLNESKEKQLKANRTKEVSLDDRVSFEFNYPKDYPVLKKRFKNGDKVSLHPLTAKGLEEKGIGKIVQ